MTTDHTDWGYSIDPNAYAVTLWARTRRLLAANVRMGLATGDTGREHGPVQWLEAAPPAPVQTHRAERLFAPVDVMPGQTGLEI